MNFLKPYLDKVAYASPLSKEEAQEAFSIIISGQATAAQIGGFLMALRVRGESMEEISGAVSAMREKMVPVSIKNEALDIVGTGGDNSNSRNISTTCAFVVAGCGVPVAKHGNHGLSSQCGSADVLKALGVNIDLSPKKISFCIRKVGIGFMFSPIHHPAMKQVATARTELGTRTIFNLLGPLCNPADVKRQLIGVFSSEWIIPFANILKALGSKAFWIVNGNGIDEITTTGETSIAAFKNDVLSTFTFVPEDVGLKRVNPEALRGGTAIENAQALFRVLEGEHGPYRDIVLLNTAAALIIADRANTLTEGMALAALCIDSGKAKVLLETLITFSNEEKYCE